jgi:hypothetical protein
MLSDRTGRYREEFYVPGVLETRPRQAASSDSPRSRKHYYHGIGEAERSEFLGELLPDTVRLGLAAEGLQAPHKIFG